MANVDVRERIIKEFRDKEAAEEKAQADAELARLKKMQEEAHAWARNRAEAMVGGVTAGPTIEILKVFSDKNPSPEERARIEALEILLGISLSRWVKDRAAGEGASVIINSRELVEALEQVQAKAKADEKQLQKEDEERQRAHPSHHT